jgi:iron complex outermembrane receptor protein
MFPKLHSVTPASLRTIVYALLVVVSASVSLGQENAQEPGAAEATPSMTADGTTEAQRVIVTGSNIPTAEEVGPNPVDTYRRDDITRLGARTPTDLIERLPVAFGASSNENQTATADSSATISLRGIDPKETLVLQDGRRLASVGFSGLAVDFNRFPFGLIDHVDILKDGASPNYGSDAVAGVVNVFLIHRFHGVEVYGSYGNTNLGFAGDMAQKVAYLLAGTGDSKTDIVVYGGVFDQDAIFSRDIPISRDTDFTRLGGSDNRSGNFAGRVNDFVYQPSLNGGSKTPTPHAYPNVQGDPQYVPRLSLPRERQLFNIDDYTSAIPETNREYVYVSGVHDIFDKYLTAFVDFNYFRQFWNAFLAPRPFDHDIWTDATHPFGISSSGFSVPIQNPFNPFTVANYVSPGGFDPQFPGTQKSAAPAGTAFTTGVRYRGLEGGSGNPQITTNNYLVTGGLRGNLGEFADTWNTFKTWNWEFAVRWNEDDRVNDFHNLINNNALRAALLDTNPATAFNPFGLNQNTQSVIDRVFVTTHEVGSTTLLTEDLKLYGDLFDLPAGPLSFAIGAEHLRNDLSDIPDHLTASGQITGSAGFLPTEGGRFSWSIWWETLIPLVTPKWNLPGVHSLELDYAERFEDYSDFGETERPKFSIRWQPLNGSPVPITLRAAYIEAFHAPALVDLFGGTTQGSPRVNDPVTGVTQQVLADFTANPNLQPDVAYERTFGGVLTPETWWNALRGLTITVDYGHLDLRGFQTQLDPQFLIDHESEFPGLVVRDPNAGNRIVLLNVPTLNLGRLIESYIDYEAVEIFETARLGHGDWGTFTATLNGTYLTDVDIQAVPNGKRTTAVGKFGGGFQGISGGGAYTHNRWYASLFYDGASATWMRGIDTGAIVHYIGQYWDSRDFTFNGQPRKVREWTTVDLLLNYTFNLRSSAGREEVPGYAKYDGKTAKDGKDKNVMPVSTAQYSPYHWRAWLDNTTFTVGVNNVFNFQPPFVAGAAAFAGAAENGYDEATANPKGRFWYVALKKRF